MNKQWKVGDLAKLTGLTIRTLRYYDQIGLLSPSGQTASGHRLYDGSDLSRLHQIVALKELGLSLDEVKSALDGGRVRPLDIVNLQIGRLKERIGKQRKLLEQLEHAAKRLEGKAPLAVEDFASLLHAMKMEFEKPVLERQSSVERQLGLLGHFLAEQNGTRNNERNNEEENR